MLFRDRNHYLMCQLILELTFKKQNISSKYFNSCAIKIPQKFLKREILKKNVLTNHILGTPLKKIY